MYFQHYICIYTYIRVGLLFLVPWISWYSFCGKLWEWILFAIWTYAYVYIYVLLCVNVKKMENVQVEEYTYYTRTWSHVHTKMCKFCGLYSWSLTHTLCNPNINEAISFLFRNSLFGSEGSEIECSCSRTKRRRKLLTYGMIHISAFFSSRVHII